MRELEKKLFRPKENMLDFNALTGLAGIMKEYGVAGVRPADGYLEFVGLEKDAAPAFEKEIQRWIVPVECSARVVKACRGLKCRNGMGDAGKMAALLWEKIKDHHLPGKFRIGVSACPNNCAGGPVRDLGLFATARGWTVMAGGSAGRNPRLADRIASGLDDGQALELAESILGAYIRLAGPKERIGALIRRTGTGEFSFLAGAGGEDQ
ncbi:MAG: hypothetical protein ACOY30_02305 [Bacillota bacterium]